MLTIRECTGAERERYDAEESTRQSLGKAHGSGDTLRLVFEEDGRWVALQTWTSAPWCLKPRDEFLGWPAPLRARRLKLVAYNRRFTLLCAKGERPNLASRVLGLAVRELPNLWFAKWGYAPLLAETFCDIEASAGTCYRAAGWTPVGRTKGFTRHRRDFYVPNERPKVLFLKELAPGAFQGICAPELPPECRGGVLPVAPGAMPLPAEEVQCLFDHLSRVDDPRRSNKTFRIGTLLSMLCMGAMSGARDLMEAWRFCSHLTDCQRERIGCPRKRDGSGRRLPGYGTLRKLLLKLAMKSFGRHLSTWMTAQSADGRTLKIAVDGKFVKGLAGIVSLVDAETGTPLAVAPCSQKEGLKGECELPVAQRLIDELPPHVRGLLAADALHTQDKTARLQLENDRDYLLQIKNNQPGLLKRAPVVAARRPCAGVKKTRKKPTDA